ncbi:MAG: substrate-binding domain-containing protein [Opitutaceae bacterium]
MKRIALAIETSLASGREIVMGISRYLDTCTDWSIFQLTGQLGVMDTDAIRHWEGDGIIARIANPKVHDLIKSKGLPTVDVLGNVTPYSFPVIKCDDNMIGITAAGHLCDNGLRNLVFVGVRNELWASEREEGFLKAAQSSGAKTSSCYLERDLPDYGTSQQNIETIRELLENVPLPMGIMVASDQFAPLVFEACHQLGLFIPDQASVIGVDNDSPYCHLCRPRLSSIAPNHQRVGYEAASLLDRLIAGETAPQQVYKVEPHSLYPRLSSNFLSVEDPQLVKAIHYIRKNAHTGASLDDIARHVGLSRSSLQRNTKQLLKRSVGELVIAEKIRIACELLTYSDLSLTIVAERSGFRSQEYLNQVFRKHMNTTPRKFRIAQRS